MDNRYFLSLTKEELDAIIQANVEATLTRVLEEFDPNRLSKPSQETSEYLDIEGLSDFLGCSEQTIHTYKKKRGLPYFKKGKTVLFKKSEVLEWMKSERNR
jgi:excisionase family DNA binding protein